MYKNNYLSAQLKKKLNFSAKFIQIFEIIISFQFISSVKIDINQLPS